MNLHPIRNAEDHKRALARLNEIWAPPVGSPDGDEFEVLGILVEAYERAVYPIAPVSPVEAIEFMLDQRGLDRKALEPLLGSRGRVSEVMTGKRSLSIEMIRALHDELRIPLEVLVARPTKMGAAHSLRSRARTVAKKAAAKSRTIVKARARALAAAPAKKQVQAAKGKRA